MYQNCEVKKMKKHMYIRVSTKEQNTDRQKELIKKYKPDFVYEEKISSAKDKRHELEKMLNNLQNGDCVIVESLSRLFRSTKHLLALMDDFNTRKIELISDKESIDTKTAHGKFIFSIFAAQAQMERDLLIERVQDGIFVARKNGVKFGRPKIDDKIILSAIELHKTKKYSVNTICKQLGISRASFYRGLKNINEINRNEIMRGHAKLFDI